MKNNIVIQFSAFLLFFFGFLYSGNAQIAQKIGDNPGSITSSAVLDVESTTKGFLPPRMTTTQRNNILNPATGLSIFNSDTRSLEINTGTAAARNFRNATSKVFSCLNINNQIINSFPPNASNINFGNIINNDFGAGALDPTRIFVLVPDAGTYLVSFFFRIAVDGWRTDDELTFRLRSKGVVLASFSTFPQFNGNYGLSCGGQSILRLNPLDDIWPALFRDGGGGEITINYFYISIIKL